MAEIIALTVYAFDGTVVENGPETKQMVVGEIVNIYPSSSGDQQFNFALGNVKSAVYANTEAGIKAYYCGQTPAEIAALANA